MLTVLNSERPLMLVWVQTERNKQPSLASNTPETQRRRRHRTSAPPQTPGLPGASSGPNGRNVAEQRSTTAQTVVVVMKMKMMMMMLALAAGRTLHATEPIPSQSFVSRRRDYSRGYATL